MYSQAYKAESMRNRDAVSIIPSVDKKKDRYVSEVSEVASIPTRCPYSRKEINTKYSIQLIAYLGKSSALQW